jgi:hypothetical protein
VKGDSKANPFARCCPQRSVQAPGSRGERRQGMTKDEKLAQIEDLVHMKDVLL